MRLLPVPEALYREIERRSRASSLTTAAYLQSLIALDSARQPGEGAAVAPVTTPSTPVAGGADTELEPKDIFARVQERQTSDLASVGADSFDDEPGRRGE